MALLSCPDGGAGQWPQSPPPPMSTQPPCRTGDAPQAHRHTVIGQQWGHTVVVPRRRKGGEGVLALVFLINQSGGTLTMEQWTSVGLY